MGENVQKNIICSYTAPQIVKRNCTRQNWKSMISCFPWWDYCDSANSWCCKKCSYKTTYTTQEHNYLVTKIEILYSYDEYMALLYKTIFWINPCSIMVHVVKCIYKLQYFNVKIRVIWRYFREFLHHLLTTSCFNFGQNYYIFTNI